MSRSILIMGPSGSGKSTSVMNLNPKETFIISALGKDMPFRGSSKNYTIYSKADNPNGNVVVTSHAKVVAEWLKHISSNKPEIKTIIIEDNTFITAKELDRRREEKDFTKFNDIAHDFLVLAELANTLRADLKIYFLHHVKEEGDGILEPRKTRAMSYGKLVDEKLGQIEAQFNIVLLATKQAKDDNTISYGFKTSDPHSSAKSPIGMFEDAIIPNDLEFINRTIDCYYENC